MIVVKDGARRDSDFQDLPQHVPVYAQLPGIHTDHKLRPDQDRKQNHRVDQIGKHRRRGGAVPHIGDVPVAIVLPVLPGLGKVIVILY